jgi:hypothetical protein
LKIEELKNTGTETEFQAENLAENFLTQNGFSDSVKVNYKNAIRSFYSANWRDLNKNMAKNLTPPEPKQRSPTMDDLLKLDEIMSCARDKALLWLLAVTGDNATFGIFAYSTSLDNPLDYSNSVYNVGRKQTNGTLYEHEGTRDFYLRIFTTNTDNYSIKVEYDASAVSDFSTPKPTADITTYSVYITIIGVTIAVILLGLSYLIRKKKRTNIQTLTPPPPT